MAETAARQTPRLPAAAWLEQAPAAMRLSFCGDAAARAALEPVWGAGFSEQACRANVNGTRATLWLGPDEYLLLDFAAEAAAAAPSQPSIVSTLEQSVADIPHSLVDISHRQFAFEVSGPHAAAILNGACPLDLDLGEFPAGMCTRTVLAKADIVLWRTGPETFHLEVWRSFAAYVGGILGEIAAEFYPRAGA